MLPGEDGAVPELAEESGMVSVDVDAEGLVTNPEADAEAVEDGTTVMDKAGDEALEVTGALLDAEGELAAGELAAGGLEAEDAPMPPLPEEEPPPIPFTA